MVFGEVLRELRNDMGLTQAELASELKLSRAAVAGYENSGKEPTFEVLIRVARYFGVTTDYILGLKQQSKEDHQMDFKFIIDEAVGDAYYVRDEHGDTIFSGFDAIIYETLEDAIEAGAIRDIAKLLVATTKAVREISANVKECAEWVPEDLLLYDLEDESFDDPEILYSQKDDLVQYSKDTIGLIRANQFRAKAQSSVAHLTGSADRFVRNIYKQLNSGKLPKNWGGKHGNSNKKGK